MTHLQLGRCREASMMDHVFEGQLEPSAFSPQQATQPQLRFAVQHCDKNTICDASAQETSPRYVSVAFVHFLVCQCLMKYLNGCATA